MRVRASPVVYILGGGRRAEPLRVIAHDVRSFHPGQVGSLGDEAAQVARALPVGRGYVCEDAEDIPRTFAHIFRRASALDLLWL